MPGAASEFCNHGIHLTRIEGTKNDVLSPFNN